jgi:hypothetical protein
MMKFIFKLHFVFAVFLLLANQSDAQIYSSSDSTAKPTPLPRQIIKRPKPITKETSFGARIHTDGWSVFFESGKVKSDDMKRIDMFHDVRILQFEFSERRHPKELRMFGWDINKQSDRKYTFGKVNNFYALKFNIGNRKMIAGKPYPNSVSVHWVYAGGLSLGLLKPYYVEAYISKDGGQTFEKNTIKYTPEMSPYFLNPVYVIGAASFTQGLGEMKIVPGLHLKTALHFDYAKDKFLVSAVEVGGSAEFYTSKIELMANQKAVPYFFNLYAGIQFGKRRR